MFCGVCHTQLTMLLAVAAVASIQVPEPSLSVANERTSIERTYELTKYLEHQLKEIKDTYLSYLGPPFNDPDFSPPRPNSTALSLPSAATRLELWRGLENRARLAQNQRAYAVLLGAVRELARSTLCPYLQTSLLHFSTGLDGLLGSISGLMSTLGYALPPPPSSSSSSSSPAAGAGAQYPRREAGGERARRPAPLVTQSLYEEQGGAGGAGASPGRVARGGREEGGRRDWTERKKDRERGREGRRGAEASGASGRGAGARHEDRGERGRRGRRREAESRGGASDEEEDEEAGGAERWGGRRRRLLSVPEEGETTGNTAPLAAPEPGVTLSLPGGSGFSQHNNYNNNNNNNNNKDYNLYSYNLNYNPQAREREEEFPSLHAHRRTPRSLLPPTLHPPLSLFYPFGPGGEGHAMLSEPVPLSLRRGRGPPPPPLPLTPLLASLSSSSSSSSSLLSVRPALNDFSRKVEGFWVLRELQSWLWRSAKDFNRLKKRLRV